MKTKDFFDAIWGRLGLVWCKQTNCSVDKWHDDTYIRDGKEAEQYYWINVSEDDVLAILRPDTEITIRDGNLIISKENVVSSVYAESELELTFYEKGPKIELV